MMDTRYRVTFSIQNRGDFVAFHTEEILDLVCAKTIAQTLARGGARSVYVEETQKEGWVEIIAVDLVTEDRRATRK